MMNNQELEDLIDQASRMLLVDEQPETEEEGTDERPHDPSSIKVTFFPETMEYGLDCTLQGITPIELLALESYGVMKLCKLANTLFTSDQQRAFVEVLKYYTNRRNWSKIP